MITDMKKILNKRNSVTLVAMTTALIGVFSSTHAEAQEVEGRIGLKGGKSPIGFIQGSKEDAILFSTTKGGAGKCYSIQRIERRRDDPCDSD